MITHFFDFLSVSLFAKQPASSATTGASPAAEVVVVVAAAAGGGVASSTVGATAGVESAASVATSPTPSVNTILISRSALASESDPCTAFSEPSLPKTARILVGAVSRAFSEFVGPASSLQALMAPGFSRTIAYMGALER